MSGRVRRASGLLTSGRTPTPKTRPSFTRLNSWCRYNAAAYGRLVRREPLFAPGVVSQFGLRRTDPLSCPFVGLLLFGRGDDDGVRARKHRGHMAVSKPAHH